MRLVKSETASKDQKMNDREQLGSNGEDTFDVAALLEKIGIEKLETSARDTDTAKSFLEYLTTKGNTSSF